MPMSEGIGRRDVLKGLVAIAGGALLGSCSGMPSPDACADRAKAYYDKGDHVHAIRWLDDLIAQDATRPEAFDERGWSYFQLNQFTQAIEDYDKAIALKNGCADYHAKRGFAYNMRSVLRGGSLFDTQGALDDFQKAIELNDNLADAHAGLGFTYLLINDKEKAYASFKKSKRLMGTGHPLQHLQSGRVDDAYRQIKAELGIKDDA